MINFKKIIKEQLTKSFFFVFFSSLIFTWVILAVTWPASPPSSETPWGNFMKYFNNMLVNTGSDTQWVVKQAETLWLEWSGAVLTINETNIKTLGSLQFGSDNESCITDKAGATRYNNTNSMLEYCNGVTWMDIGWWSAWIWSENNSNIYRSSGNVGIGTATPSQKLHINGNIKVDGRHIFLWSQDLWGNNNWNLYYDSNNNSYTKMIFRDNQKRIYGTILWAGNGNYFGLLDGDWNRSYLAVKDNYTQFRINNSAKMTIKSNGNIGIGTTTPWTQLDVKWYIRASRAIQLNDLNGQNNQKWMMFGRDNTLAWARVNNNWWWVDTEMRLSNTWNLKVDGSICDGRWNCIRGTDRRNWSLSRYTAGRYHGNCKNSTVIRNSMYCASACNRRCATWVGSLPGHGFKWWTAVEARWTAVQCSCWK